MIVYYLYKAGERLADCPFPIKEGDICMLFDGEFVKTIYIDNAVDSDSIWRTINILIPSHYEVITSLKMTLCYVPPMKMDIAMVIKGCSCS